MKYQTYWMLGNIKVKDKLKSNKIDLG